MDVCRLKTFLVLPSSRFCEKATQNQPEHQTNPSSIISPSLYSTSTTLATTPKAPATPTINTSLSSHSLLANKEKEGSPDKSMRSQINSQVKSVHDRKVINGITVSREITGNFQHGFDTLQLKILNIIK